MKEKIRIREVLDRWELDNPRPETQLHEETPRQIFTIRTDSGRYVLKGYPHDIPESTVQGNVRAHLFLGNEKGLAPRVYPARTGEYHELIQCVTCRGVPCVCGWTS